MRRNGFTLVELSIVLVIIGLLIGGILVAQSMISTSKIAATVSQIQQFDAGTASFYAAYKYLPGDSPARGGDGDGIITRTSTSSNRDINLFECEIANYWHHIAPDKYASTTCSLFLYTYRAAMTNKVPFTKIGIKDGFFIASAIGTGSWSPNTTSPRNYYAMVSPYNYPSCFNCADFGQAATSVFHSVTTGNRTVSPADLLAIDKKLDDGIANTGYVIGGGFPTGNSGISPAELATCSVSGVYQLQNTGYECTPLVEIGALTGLNR